ncbi:MAG: hypothetical protein FWC41_11635 [Firmicutes bacterium]|nr:hypothetical protein [Bacillota bacterium]
MFNKEIMKKVSTAKQVNLEIQDKLFNKYGYFNQEKYEIFDTETYITKSNEYGHRYFMQEILFQNKENKQVNIIYLLGNTASTRGLLSGKRNNYMHDNFLQRELKKEIFEKINSYEPTFVLY